MFAHSCIVFVIQLSLDAWVWEIKCLLSVNQRWKSRKRDEEYVEGDEESVKCVLRVKKNKVGTLSLGRGIREDEGYVNEEYVQDCI